MKKTSYLFILLLILSVGFLTAKSTSALSTPSRLKGKILLQVESKGEAWYVSPADGKRYSMGRPADAFNLMRQLGIGISNNNLAKIQIANENLTGQDSDGDGLSNMVEDSIGTDKNNKDSDGDGYNDKDEILSGNNPNGSGKLNLDNNFAKSQAGKILLQVEQNGEAWYINPDNYQRYFLGRPGDAFNLMRKLGLGISNNDLNKITQASGQGINQTCVESWTCSSWSICQSNQQTRSCSDSKNCGTTNNNPLTSQSCTVATATCSAQGGENCSAANKECIGNKVNASDTSVCCLTGCVIKSCSAQAGNKCSFSGSCSSEFFTAGDTDRCCKNACTICGAAGYTKSDGLPGVVCGQGQRCASGGATADDGVLCCSNNCVADTAGTQAACSDSDGGKNYNVAGVTTEPNDTGEINSYSDSCSTYYTGKDLIEHFCNSNGITQTSETHTCDYKCQNGACFSPPTTCSSGDNYCPSGCTYQQDHDCQCQKDLDCLTGNANSATKCSGGTCINSSISQTLQVSGDLNGFCGSYIDNCTQSAIINLGGTNNLQAQVNGKSAGHTECNIKLLWGDRNYIVDFWVDIGDSLEACMHNVPIYFYHSANTMCGSAPCYGEFP